MRTSHKAKDAAAGKRSYVCDTFTGHGRDAAGDHAQGGGPAAILQQAGSPTTVPGPSSLSSTQTLSTPSRSRQMSWPGSPCSAAKRPGLTG
jgi:hypothetical protein